jgi:predicted DNA-binding transcriptional regulator AlpA
MARLAKTPKPLLDSNQLMEWIGITESTLERWITNDPTFPMETPGYGAKKLRRFDEDKIRAWMARDTDASAA